MTSSSPSEATAPKQITAAELREYLHLPAKDVAKELGMCLTSLKKVCRQHGILRWPYRRLKMIDRKIQSLEHHIAEGAEDQEDVRRQLEKLHNERAALPCNYGSGVLEEAESDPSSPLSCASTTVTHDMFAGVGSPGAEEGDLDLSDCLPHHAPALVKPEPPAVPPPPPAAAPMTAAAALISSLPPAASPRPHASSPRPHARTTSSSGRGRSSGEGAQVQAQAVQSKGVEEDGTMRVELSLSPELASQVAKGAQLVVRHHEGQATLQIIPVGADPDPAGAMLVSLPPSMVPAAKKEEVEEEAVVQAASSDEDMIAALVGCAAEKASQESEPHPPALPDGLDEMSDEALALALAGCVGETQRQGQEEEEEEAHGCHELVACDGEVPVWYQDEEPHDLDMSLFEQEA